MSPQTNADESSMNVSPSGPKEYRPLVMSRRPFPGYPSHWLVDDSLIPIYKIPLAGSSSYTHQAPKGHKRVNSEVENNPELEKVMQNIPTHLLRTSDMKLVAKVDVLHELLSYITASDVRTWRSASFAILSHRWGDGEPTYRDMWGQPDHDRLRKTHAGFRKLKRFCWMAQAHGCNWAWADTCCIDKTSSAELDEAIRSMYRWYENAAICIVYLADTDSIDDLAEDSWFTRGWTLQELLAPQRIKFFNRNWHALTPDQNDKDEQSTLIPILSDITTIPWDDIAYFQVGTGRIREKMCWAASRKTTRVEDIAYSLIGIFDVSMAIMYGEGSRAFHRLQLAVAEQTNTTELFFWQGDLTESYYNSMFAARPQYFALTTDVRLGITLDEVKQCTPRDVWRSIGNMFASGPVVDETSDLLGYRFWKEEAAFPSKFVALQRREREILKNVRPEQLQHMDARTVQRVGPAILRRMDGETLRRIGPMLLLKHPQLEGLLDDATREKLMLEVSWIPWGAQQYTMTGAGLAIDVVLYDYGDVWPRNSSDPDEALTIRTDNRRLRRKFRTHSYRNTAFDDSPKFFDSSYATVASKSESEDGTSGATEKGTKLAILDYYWGDTSHDPGQLRIALQESYSRDVGWHKHDELDVHSVITELETRLYRGVFLNPDTRGKDCFTRSWTGESNMILRFVRRPKGGWDQPRQIYIK